MFIKRFYISFRWEVNFCLSMFLQIFKHYWYVKQPEACESSLNININNRPKASNSSSQVLQKIWIMVSQCPGYFTILLIFTSVFPNSALIFLRKQIWSFAITHGLRIFWIFMIFIALGWWRDLPIQICYLEDEAKEVEL